MKSTQSQDITESNTGPSVINMAVIFVDVEDSTGIANYFESTQYRDFLQDFHKVVNIVLDEPKWSIIKSAQQYHKFFGDEFIAFLPVDHFPDPVADALDLAFKLKLQWYVSKRNLDRLSSEKEPIELNVGINYGIVNIMQYPTTVEGEESRVTFEGFPITIAKRVQSKGEEGKASRIILADPAFRAYASRHGEKDFYNMGKKTLKGLSQPITCYEWLGKDFDLRNYKLDLFDERIEFTIKTLRDKDPLNPWYATLLANLYYSRAEIKYYEGEPENKWYLETSKVCLNAIQTISWVNLRSLSTLLFTCLEARKVWPQLSHRTEQAFNNDPTFADALALRSKAILESAFRPKIKKKDKDDILGEAEKEADRLISLFEDETLEKIEREALFWGYFVKAAISSYNDDSENAIKYLRTALEYAKEINLRWAKDELAAKKETIFKEISKSSEWLEIENEFLKIKEPE